MKKISLHLVDATSNIEDLDEQEDLGGKLCMDIQLSK